jgi:hypothetical protein
MWSVDTGLGLLACHVAQIDCDAILDQLSLHATDFSRIAN